LVRDAIDSVYKKKDKLEQRRKVALSAYQEGFISLVKMIKSGFYSPIKSLKDI